jgi:hypothetical protein
MVRFMFKAYHALKYKFIINENTAVLENINLNEKYIKNNLSLLHPVANINPSDLELGENIEKLIDKKKINRKKIGIIGKFRQEKKLDETLKLLLKLQKELDFLLIIGTNDLSSFDQTLFATDRDNILLVDTSSKKSYLEALGLCDFIILNYEKSKYYYRCSGVAADAIGARTYVVCPNFPMMSSQVNHPTQVGLVYEDESDLEESVRQALQLIPPSENTAFEAHYTERSIKEISSVLVEQLESRIEC